ncbi:PA2169 family four-helix-bundle protein [Ramlibacter tataouinensis]|uniref:ferritin-like domain-containing protein n=1 Tax=Ramlibacter tataouinensis TaxID=94132 RepID=UPI0022F39D91|nr:PA2169 family four-helix-bundle protein [Ramlibacter tataouinensis]WBY03550.1 PA2169 family four-helix-bundle protein [Ramlibacter tataouinensis]
MAEDKDLNRDPITDEPGSHPVGTGVGATGGAVAGAAAGAIGGPVGSMVGGVIGAVVGGLAGKAAAEAINPTAEEAHWRDNYTREPYYEQGRSFDDYGPAYMHGVHGRMRHETDWDAAEPRLASEWDNARAGSGLSWEQARPASRAAWDRAELQRGGSGAGMAGSTGSMASDTAVVRAGDLAGGEGRSAIAGGTDMAGAGIGTDTRGSGTAQGGGAAALVGSAQSAGNMSGDTGDVIDALQDLVECCKDGEYGFQACADQAQRADLKSVFLQRADDCRRGAEELNQQIRQLGGSPEDSGSAAGALHRGWVSVKSTLSTYDDKAVLEEAERGEDNALARYRKALKQPLPAQVKPVVERQFQLVQRNHDQVKLLRDQFRAAAQ